MWVSRHLLVNPLHTIRLSIAPLVSSPAVGIEFNGQGTREENMIRAT